MATPRQNRPNLRLNTGPFASDIIRQHSAKGLPANIEQRRGISKGFFCQITGFVESAQLLNVNKPVVHCELHCSAAPGCPTPSNM